MELTKGTDCRINSSWGPYSSGTRVTVDYIDELSGVVVVYMNSNPQRTIAIHPDWLTPVRKHG